LLLLPLIFFAFRFSPVSIIDYCFSADALRVILCSALMMRHLTPDSRRRQARGWAAVLRGERSGTAPAKLATQRPRAQCIRALHAVRDT